MSDLASVLIRTGPRGEPGGAATDYTDADDPQLLANSAALDIPGAEDPVSRIFIAGSAAAVTGITIPDGVTGQKVKLVGTSDSNTVGITNAANLKLSGDWVARDGSILSLEWDNDSRWLEESRNEI